MNRIKKLSFDLINTFDLDELSKVEFLELCKQNGIDCFEYNFDSNTYGYIDFYNNKISLKLNKYLTGGNKDIAIAYFLAVYILNKKNKLDKIYLNSSNFKNDNEYYTFALNLYFEKKINEKILNKHTIEILKRGDNSMFKLNEIDKLSKKLNLSFVHIFNYLNI